MQHSGHRARKRFGQNFLVDPLLIQRIIESIHPERDETIIEIGPGQGALTAPLLASTCRLTAIEIDRDLAGELQVRFPTLDLVIGDALKIDMGQLLAERHVGSAKLVGNLPYNISTPLLFHLFAAKARVKAMYFMLQQEVVDRLAAQANDPAYGRLSVMAQYHCQVEPLIHIPPHAFRPAPKVDSCFVMLIPHQPAVTALDYEHFEHLVNLAFQQRRKTLRNAWRALLQDNIPDTLNAQLGLRAENLSPLDFVRISNTFVSLTANLEP